MDEWCPLSRSSQCLLLQSTHNISLEISKIKEDNFEIKATTKDSKGNIVSIEKESNEYYKIDNILASITEVSALLV